MPTPQNGCNFHQVDWSTNCLVLVEHTSWHLAEQGPRNLEKHGLLLCCSMSSWTILWTPDRRRVLHVSGLRQNSHARPCDFMAVIALGLGDQIIPDFQFTKIIAPIIPALSTMKSFSWPRSTGLLHHIGGRCSLMSARCGSCTWAPGGPGRSCRPVRPPSTKAFVDLLPAD